MIEVPLIYMNKCMDLFCRNTQNAIQMKVDTRGDKVPTDLKASHSDETSGDYRPLLPFSHYKLLNPEIFRPGLRISYPGVR